MGNNNLLDQIGPVTAGTAGVTSEEEGVLDAYSQGTSFNPPAIPSDAKKSGGRGPVRSRPAAGQVTLGEAFLRHNPETDLNFKVHVFRVSQKSLSGDHVIGGWCGEFMNPITESDIYGEFGGGRFSVIIFGSHPRTGAPGYKLMNVTVDIEGVPKKVGEVTGNRSRTPVEGSSRPVLVTQHHPPNNNDGILAQTVRDLAVSARAPERNSGGDFVAMTQMLQSHQAQQDALIARHQSEMTSLKEQSTLEYQRLQANMDRRLQDEMDSSKRKLEDAERRLNTSEDRHNTELTRLRTQLEDERRVYEKKLDDLRSEYKEEIRRLTHSHQEEIKRVEHNCDSRITAIEQSKVDALTNEKARNDLVISQVTKAAENATDNLKNLFDVQKKSDEANTNIIKGTLEQQLKREEDDRRRAQQEVDRLRGDVEKKEDLSSQLLKIRKVQDLFLDFGGGREESIVPTGDSTYDKIKDLLNTPAGKKAGEVAGAILAGTAQRLMPGAAGSPAPSTPRQANPPQMPQMQPQVTRPPNVEASIEQQLRRQAPPQQQPPPPQEQQQQSSEESEMVARITRWVNVVEGHMAAGTPPEEIAKNLDRDLPSNALQGLLQLSPEMIIRQIKGAGVKMQGVLNSPEGLAYIEAIKNSFLGKA